MKANYAVSFLSLLLFSLFTINGWGQLATWNNGNVSTAMPLGTTATGVNVAATSTTRTGLTYTSSGARWNSASWNSANNYITITVTAATGYVLNLNGATVTFNMGSSGTGPTSYSLKSSVNAYASIIANVTTVNGSSVQQGDRSYTLPSTNYNGLSSITFRLLGNGATSGTGTGGPSKVVVGGTAVLAAPPCTPTSSIVTDSVCSNLLPYIWHAQSIPTGGTNVATYTMPNAGGCDSVIHLNLVIKNTNATTVNDTICNNQLPYIWHGITLTDGGMGVIQQYLQNTHGCDSIVTLNLVVKRPGSTVNDTICSSLLPYTWHGKIVNSGGLDVARDTLPSTGGCDSIIHLNLKVKAASSSTVNDTICSSLLPYTWHGKIVNNGGLDVARDTLPSAGGCDSIIHLNLKVKAASSSTVNDTVCSSLLPYTWHGKIVNASGLDVARDTALNASGCDSIIHLNLVMKAVSSSIVNVTTCHNLPYLWNGLTVGITGTNAATYHTLNASGCDSTVSLNLAVNVDTTQNNITINTTALPYTWNGISIPAGGTAVATHTVLSSTGCDSVLVLNLTVTSSPVPVTLVSFNGKANNTNNSLSWITTDEMNLSHYELERSNDQQYFVRIAMLVAAMNSSTQHAYMYNDANISNYSTLYYRLKMVDLDGTFSYSSIVVLKGNMDIVAIKAYPNPTANILNIEGLKGKTSYYVTDATGRVLLQAPSINVSTERSIKVNVVNLIAGAYFLHYQDEARSGVIRFIRR